MLLMSMVFGCVSERLSWTSSVIGLHHDLEAEVLGRLLADLLDRRVRSAGMDQVTSLAGLRPHGGKSADRLGRHDGAAGRAP